MKGRRREASRKKVMYKKVYKRSYIWLLEVRRIKMIRGRKEERKEGRNERSNIWFGEGR